MNAAAVGGRPIVLSAIGHYHPENIIDNSFFDSLDIESDGQWVVERTGIESRRSVLTVDDIRSLRLGRSTLEQLRAQGKVMGIGAMALQAFKNWQGRFGGGANSFDALICGTSVPDFDIPANASVVAQHIGAQCATFDVNSACSSFVTNLHVARAMIHAGTYKRMAIFNPERYSLRMNYADKKTCVLFGDGCSAALLESNPAADGLVLLDTIIDSDPSRYDVVKIPTSGYFDQNGSAVQKFAITRTIEITKAILERNQLSPSDLNYFAGHQANLRMVTSAAEKLGLCQDKHLFNVDRFGNQGSAGAPSVLSMNWHRFKSGDLIAVAVVGAGLTWGAALFRRV